MIATIEQIIGKTKSGKAIYNNLDAEHEVYNDFTSEEHCEAHNLHFSQVAPDNYSKGDIQRFVTIHGLIGKSHIKIADKIITTQIKAARVANKS